MRAPWKKKTMSEKVADRLAELRDQANDRLPEVRGQLVDLRDQVVERMPELRDQVDALVERLPELRDDLVDRLPDQVSDRLPIEKRRKSRKRTFLAVGLVGGAATGAWVLVNRRSRPTPTPSPVPPVGTPTVDPTTARADSTAASDNLDDALASELKLDR